MNDVPRWVRRTGAVSIAVVAVVAAVVSYSHMHDLAEHAGEGWRSWLEPLSVDGLLAGASLVLYVRRSSWPAWLALTVGLAVSLVANLADAHPDLVSRLVSAWPAVALALSYETLLTLLRRVPAPEPADADQPEPASNQGDGQVSPVDDEMPGEPGEQLTRARQVFEQARQDGRPMGRTRLARTLGVTESQARALLAELAEEHRLRVVSR